MKHHLILAALAVAVMGCTSKNEVEYISNTGIDVQVDLQISQREMSAPARGVAAETATLAQQCKFITAVLMKSDGSIAAQVQQTNTDANFGSLSFDVAVGDYTLNIMANAANAPTVNQDGTLTFTKSGDAWSVTKSVTITRTSRESVSATLTRAACCMDITSTDVCTASKVNIQFGNISTIFDISQHKGTNQTTYTTGIISCPKNASNQFAVRAYLLIPAEEISNATLTFTFYDESNQQIDQRSYSNIPLKQNYITDVTAALFHTNGANASITLTTDWNASHIQVDL